MTDNGKSIIGRVGNTSTERMEDVELNLEDGQKITETNRSWSARVNTTTGIENVD